MNFNKEGKKKLSELKNTITKIKNTLERIYSMLGNAEPWINDLENKIMGSTQSEQQKEEFF